MRLAGAGVAVAIVVAGAIAASAIAGPQPQVLSPYARLARTDQGRALLALARASMEGYWDPAAAPRAEAGPPWPGTPAGVYVSLVKGRATRACVGSPVPVRGTLAATVRSLSVEALRADPRRPPVRREELEGLRIVLSFTDPGEAVANPMLVDPGREGLLVGSPRGAVAFLPGEARTVRWALAEARRIGVLGGGDATFRRLHVVTLSEPEPIPKDGETSDAER